MFPNILEMDDRLSNTSIKFEYKHPIIIYSDYKLIKLLMILRL